MFRASQGLYERSVVVIDTNLTVDVDSLWNDINYGLPIDWWIQATAGGDTTECEQRFNFTLEINSTEDDQRVNPHKFGLNSIYPNPFNRMTTVSFELEKSAMTTLTVVDLLGREVMVIHRGVLGSGRYNTMWNAQQFGSGVYILKLESANNVMIRKVLLMK